MRCIEAFPGLHGSCARVAGRVVEDCRRSTGGDDCRKEYSFQEELGSYVNTVGRLVDRGGFPDSGHRVDALARFLIVRFPVGRSRLCTGRRARLRAACGRSNRYELTTVAVRGSRVSELMVLAWGRADRESRAQGCRSRGFGCRSCDSGKTAAPQHRHAP